MPHFIRIQQISVLNILNMLYNLHFFSSKCRLFHNATLFGFCVTHILNTECVLKFEEKKSVAKRLITNQQHQLTFQVNNCKIMYPTRQTRRTIQNRQTDDKPTTTATMNWCSYDRILPTAQYMTPSKSQWYERKTEEKITYNIWDFLVHEYPFYKI